MPATDELTLSEPAVIGAIALLLSGLGFLVTAMVWSGVLMAISPKPGSGPATDPARQSPHTLSPPLT